MPKKRRIRTRARPEPSYKQAQQAAGHMASLIAELQSTVLGGDEEEIEEEIWHAMKITKHGFLFSREETVWLDLAHEDSDVNELFRLIAKSQPEWRYVDEDYGFVSWFWRGAPEYRGLDYMDAEFVEYAGYLDV